MEQDQNLSLDPHSGSTPISGSCSFLGTWGLLVAKALRPIWPTKWHQKGTSHFWAEALKGCCVGMTLDAICRDGSMSGQRESGSLSLEGPYNLLST